MDTQDATQTQPSNGASRTPTGAESAPSPRETLSYPDDQPKAEAGPQKTPPAQDSPEKALNAPEKPTDHEYRLQVPPGMQLDQELLTAAAPVLRDAGISNDQANKLVPLVNEVQTRLQKSQLDEFSALQASWRKAAKADREIGGEHLSETVRLAGVALKAGGAGSATHEARRLLDDSGLGDHPAMARLFRKMGAEIERLQRQAGVSGGGGNGPREQTSYPDDPPNH